MTAQGSFSNVTNSEAQTPDAPQPRINLGHYTDLKIANLSAAYIVRAKNNYDFILKTQPLDDDRTFQAVIPSQHTETADKLKQFLARYSLRLTVNQAQDIRMNMCTLPATSQLKPPTL